jgi:hypothetical protein
MERDLLAAVRELCAWLRLPMYHTYDSRRSEPGFLDCVIVGRAVLFRELKAERGRITKDQQRWLDALTEAGADAGVWRPRQLRDGTIVRELKALKA